MRLATLTDGRCVRVEADEVVPLPGRLVDHLCRPPAQPTAPALPVDEADLGAPIPAPRMLVCLGLNYADHAKESGQALPETPLLFAKAPSCVIGPRVPIEMPPGEVQLDFEAELAVVVGRPARKVSADEAMDVVGGYACFNDVSERVAQLGDGQWFRGKSHDTFGPFGPFVVTPEDVVDPHDLGIRCRVNGELRQDSNTSQMVFSVAEIVSYCSHVLTLQPGDLIATGTPAGVALGDGRWLQPGDVVTVEIDGLGELTNPVAAPVRP